MFKKALLLSLALMVMAGMFGMAGTVEAADYTIRVGYQDRDIWLHSPGEEPVPDPQTAFALIFEQYVETNTGGAVEVERFPESALGEAAEMVEMVQTGTLDVCNVSGVMGPFYPEFQLIYMPYVFQSPAVAQHFFDTSDFWAELEADMEDELGIKVLGMGQNGLRHFTSNEKLITEPGDLEGQRIRVMDSPIYVRQLEAVGADPVPIAWGELYTSLESGVIEGQENPISVINLGSLYEVQDYLTLDAHTYSENISIMNRDLFEELPDEYQTVVREAGRLASQADRAAEALMSRITAWEVMEENFEEIYSPTPDEIEDFREAMQPPVVEWLEGEIGEEIVEEFFEAVDEAHEYYGY